MAVTIQLEAVQNFDLSRIQSYDHAPRCYPHAENYVLLLNYKLMLFRHDLSNTRFVECEFLYQGCRLPEFCQNSVLSDAVF
jgi:hypothetical protein